MLQRARGRQRLRLEEEDCLADERSTRDMRTAVWLDDASSVCSDEGRNAVIRRDSAIMKHALWAEATKGMA